MDAKVIWDRNLSFSGTADSGFKLPLGANADVGGDEDGFRPMELIAIGLAGCTAMDVISILEKKCQQVTGFEVQAHMERAREHPRVFTRGVIEYHITGRGVEEGAVLRAIELSVTKYCPAHAMLEKAFPIEVGFSIFEAGRGEEPILVKRGEYKPE